MMGESMHSTWEGEDMVVKSKEDDNKHLQEEIEQLTKEEERHDWFDPLVQGCHITTLSKELKEETSDY